MHGASHGAQRPLCPPVPTEDRPAELPGFPHEEQTGTGLGRAPPAPWRRTELRTQAAGGSQGPHALQSSPAARPGGSHVARAMRPEGSTSTLHDLAAVRPAGLAGVRLPGKAVGAPGWRGDSHGRCPDSPGCTVETVPQRSQLSEGGRHGFLGKAGKLQTSLAEWEQVFSRTRFTSRDST